jgi:hypothetical protein
MLFPGERKAPLDERDPEAKQGQTVLQVPTY